MTDIAIYYEVLSVDAMGRRTAELAMIDTHSVRAFVRSYEKTRKRRVLSLYEITEEQFYRGVTEHFEKEKNKQ